MVLDLIKLFPDNEPVPNKFSIAMGESIRKARIEAGFNQTDVSERVYRRQAAISDIENGKMVIDALTLIRIAIMFNKPIEYFFPWPWQEHISQNKFTVEEFELILQARRLEKSDLRKLIAQARAMADMAESIERDE